MFPITEIGFIAADLKNQRKFVDFIIKYTSSLPNVTLTHSYYPYNMDYTTHKITPIKELINEDIEKKIWYGNSWLAKSKPDLKMLKELSNKMNSGLVLIFKIAIDSNSVVDIFKYTGYLVDIENNRSFKEFYSTEQSSSATNFGILEKMTKELFESYLKSNS